MTLLLKTIGLFQIMSKDMNVGCSLVSHQCVHPVHNDQIHTVRCNTGRFQAMPAFYTNFEVARLKVTNNITDSMVALR